MTKTLIPVSKYMTNVPHTLSKNHTLEEAKKTMREHDIRHLPILEGGKILGILSEKDIDFIANYHGTDIKKERIEQAMTFDPYIVAPTANLDEVCRVMRREKIGSVLIEENKKIVGIFTWVDALRALEEVL